jgi:pimeloyl-ACP methyl ester carboxylesterase
MPISSNFSHCANVSLSMNVLSDANLIFFPGIAANERTFEYMRPCFPNLHVPRWLPLEKNETLQHYVQRLVESIPSHILRQPFYLGGHSFGGIIAQEASALIPPEAIFLISSFRSHHGISPTFKLIERLTRMIPLWLLRPAVAPYRYLAPLVRRGEKEQLQLLVNMFYDTPLEITRWGAQCSTSYQGSHAISVPIHHVHGSDDPLLPLRLVQPNVVIPRGTHLIPITHAPEVARFIAARLPAAPCGADFPVCTDGVARARA